MVMAMSGVCPALAQADCETTAGARRCLAARADSAEAELRVVLDSARRMAQGPAQLDAAQAAWRRYVEQDCRAAADVYRGGSLAPVAALSCRVDQLRARIRHLRDDYLADDPAPGRRGPPEEAALPAPDADLDELHHRARLAHVTAEPRLMGLERPLSQAANGVVTTQTVEQMLARFGRYVGNSRFLEWEDERPPVTWYSADSSAAVSLIEKRVRLLAGPPGQSTADAARFAWTEFWTREPERWVLRFVTSTSRPEGPDSIAPAAREAAWATLAAAREALGGAGRIAAVRGASYSAGVMGPRGAFTTQVESWRDGRAVLRQEFPGRAPFELRRAVVAPGGDTIGSVERTMIEGHEIPLLAIAPESRWSNPRGRPRERFEGAECEVVRFTDVLGGDVDVLYDAATRRPRAMRLRNHTGRGERDIVLVLDDWRTVAGVLLPHAAEYRQGGDRYRYVITSSRVY